MYEKAIEIDPKFASPWNNLGIVYSDLKDYDKAKEMYEKAIEIDPKYAYSWHGLGYLHLTLGRFREAIPYLLKSIEIEPDISCYVNSGIAHYCIEEVEKGREFFEKGLSCAADSTGAHDQLDKVTALLGLEKKDEALALLKEISQKNLPAALLSEFFTDLQILAGAPRPPSGIKEFIAEARQILNYM